jgi:tetratricopeptide (TPR) repeat protein
MIPCLSWYFEVHGYYAEALSAFKAAVDRFRLHGASASLQSAVERSAFAFLVDSLGWFEFRTGNVGRGTTLLAESLELAREDNDPEVLYYIYGNWGYLALLTGDISEANRLTTESLSCAEALNSPWHRAIPISVLGIVAYQQEKFTEAQQQLAESLKLWRSVGDPRGLVFCMLYLGMTTLALGDIPATRSIVQEINQIAEANMDRWAHAFGLDMLGMVSLSQDQNEAALAYFSQSLALSNEIGDQMFGTQTIVHMGQAHAALQYNEEAKRLFREAYATAQQAKWTPIILNALVSFTELQNRISNETKLGVATSVLLHPAITPHLRARCEIIRGELSSSLTAGQIKVAESQAKEKSLEAWAQEILK